MNTPFSHERGLALTEFVITLPMLLILLLATAEFGRAFVQYAALSHSVNDAGRFLAGAARTSTASVNITPALEQQTRNLVVYGNVNGVGTPVLPGMQADAVEIQEVGATNVRVRGSYPFQPAVGNRLPGFWYGDGTAMTFTLEAEITMPAIPSNP